jgi:hypothetical protein
MGGGCGGGCRDEDGGVSLLALAKLANEPITPA